VKIVPALTGSAHVKLMVSGFTHQPFRPSDGLIPVKVIVGGVLSMRIGPKWAALPQLPALSLALNVRGPTGRSSMR